MAQSQSIVLKVVGLSKTFGREPEKVALQECGFELSLGSTLCILGPNGSGKSTLLRCLSGLLPFDSGKISYQFPGVSREVTQSHGRDDALAPFRGPHLGFLSQDAVLWPHMTVIENVAAPLRDNATGFENAAAVEEARKWLERCGVPEEVWNVRPSLPTVGGRPSLSGGEQRKVALARTLAMNPSILFLDEVEAHLDFQSVHDILDILDRNSMDGNTDRKTVIIVTHRTDFLSHAASRIAVMNEGAITNIFDSYESFMDAPPPGFRTHSDPMRNEILLNHFCYPTARHFAELLADHGKTIEEVVHIVCRELRLLIDTIEPSEKHLILFVTEGLDRSRYALIRSVSHSEGLQIDGEHQEILKDFAKPVLEENGRIVSRKVDDSIPDIELIRRGSPLATTNAMISWILDPTVNLENQYYKAMPHQAFAPGVIGKTVKSLKGDSHPYAELCKDTQQVYLIEMRAGGQLVGVLSIDTTSKRSWSRPMARQISLIAEIAAIAVRKLFENDHEIDQANV